MKAFFSFLSLLLFIDNAAAQQSNSVGVEIGKTVLTGTVFFDHLPQSLYTGFKVFAGFNLVRYRDAFTAGGGLYHLFGKQKHFLEMGADVGYLTIGGVNDPLAAAPRFVYPDEKAKSFMLGLNLGYRYLGKQVFKAGLAPFVIKNGVFMGGYLSGGFRF